VLKKAVTMKTKPICIYHANCPDGFTAAWVAYHAFHGDIDLHAGTHQSDPPDVTDREVYMVDFSYTRPVLAAMRERARRLVVLDHHKSAEAALRGLTGVETLLDMNRSGARIAWDYWNPEKPYPKALLHVEDYDLWSLALARTREIHANMDRGMGPPHGNRTARVGTGGRADFAQTIEGYRRTSPADHAPYEHRRP
jgi:hypothetical protein